MHMCAQHTEGSSFHNGIKVAILRWCLQDARMCAEEERGVAGWTGGGGGGQESEQMADIAAAPPPPNLLHLSASSLCPPPSLLAAQRAME